MWISINNLGQVIWLAGKYKWAWHLDLFSMTRVKSLCTCQKVHFLTLWLIYILLVSFDRILTTMLQYFFKIIIVSLFRRPHLEVSRDVCRVMEFIAPDYCIYPKYWDTLSAYYTSPKIWNSLFYYYFLMCLEWCCLYGKHYRPWSDAWSTLYKGLSVPELRVAIGFFLFSQKRIGILLFPMSGTVAQW